MIRNGWKHSLHERLFWQFIVFLLVLAGVILSFLELGGRAKKCVVLLLEILIVSACVWNIEAVFLCFAYEYSFNLVLSCCAGSFAPTSVVCEGFHQHILDAFQYIACISQGFCGIGSRCVP